MARSLLDRLLGRPERIVARAPTEAVVYSFRAKVDFFSDETRSQYCSGSIYRVREGNSKLHALVQQWIADGKVEIA